MAKKIYKWTKELIYRLLRENKYNSTQEWYADSRSSHNIARVSDYYDDLYEEFFAHLEASSLKKKQESVLTKLEKAKYKTMSAWYEDDRSLYNWVFRNKYNKVLLSKIKARFFPRKTVEWLEALLTEKQYSSIGKWSRDDQASYRWAKRRPSIYPKIRAKFFPESRFPAESVQRTRESVEKQLKERKYPKIVDWQKDDQASYNWVRLQSFYPEIKKTYFPNSIRK